MNIYWFASTDRSVIEPMLAPNEKVAREVLSATENRMENMDDYELIGVSENVGQGNPRALAEILADDYPRVTIL